MNRTVKLQASLAGAAGAIVLVAACGSSGGSNNSVVTQPQSSNGAGSTAAAVTLHSTSLGKVLADSSGKTLYILTSNGKDVKCTGGCQSIWPPVHASGTPQAAKGVTATVAANGSQVTVAGHPVYTYSADSGPGQATGEGVQTFGGTWYVLDASGTAMTSSMGGPAPSNSNPYGY